MAATDDKTSGAHTRWLQFGAFAALWLIAFGLRVVGIDFGLPFLYHPDEAEIVERALRLPLDGPNPGWFAYPSLTLYAHALLYSIVYLFSDHASYADLVAHTSKDPSTVYLAGRLMTAAAGATAVLFTGLAALRAATEQRLLTGITAGALLCAFPLHVEHSHYATSDVPLTMFAAMLAWQVADLCRKGGGSSVRNYALAGMTVGLAASTKYPGALLSVAVASAYAPAVLRVDGWRRALADWRLPAAAAAALAAFVAGSPFVLLDVRAFVRDFSTELAHMRSGHLGFEMEQFGWLTQIVNFYESGGPAFSFLLVLGALIAFGEKETFWRVAVITSVVLLAAAGSSRVLFARYLLPIVPFCCSVASSPTRKPLLRWLLIVVAVLALADMGYKSWERNRLFQTEDTRTEAWRWAGSFPPSENPVLMAAEPNAFPYREARLAGASIVPIEYNLEALREKGVRYVVLSDRMSRRYRQAPAHYPRENAFYAELFQHVRHTALFTPYPDVEGRSTRKIRSGPLIVVYELVD